MVRQNKNSFGFIRRYPKTLLVALLLIVAVIVIFALTRHHTTNNTGNGTGPAVEQNSPPPQKTEANAKTGNGSGLAQGGAVDKQGAGGTSTPTSEWTTSPSGQITLHSPTNNSTLRSGDTISGTAKVATVQYRLIDDRVGVVAQGSLTVSGGKFSGVIKFTPKASSGSLDIFSYNQNGAEINSLSVKLNLSS